MAAGLLGLLGLLVAIPSSISAEATTTTGELRTTDYGTTPITGSAFCWRGYAFKPSQTTLVTHLIGGGNTAFQDGSKEFRGAIYSATVSGGVPVSPDKLLRDVRFDGSTVNQVVKLSSDLTLEAGTWYFLAQGAVSGSVLHHYVADLNVDDLLLASQRIDDWLPNDGTSSGSAYIWGCDVLPTALEGSTPSPTPFKPAIGFRYVSTASLPSVETLSAEPLRGRLTSTGGGPTALYIEYGTSPTLSSGTTLNLSEAGYDGPVPYTYGATASGLSAGTTYYYRARAINDAGRVDGSIASFTTPAAPAAPSITGIVSGNTTLSVSFTADSDITNVRYSTDGGSTWIARSPASAASPLLITGLSNGTTYSVRLQAVREGVLGTQSAAVNGTPNAPPVLTTTSVSGITMTSADLSASVTSEASVTARGFVYATTNDPVRGASGVVDIPDGTGTASMSGAMTGLTRNTTYYVRAYAVNAAGIAYGPTQVFASAPNAISTSGGAIRWFSGPTIVDAAVTVEGEDLTGVTVSIENNRSGDVLACPDTSQTTITCAYNGTTGVLTLSGDASASIYQTVLRGVTFRATDVATVVDTRTVTFSLAGSVILDPATGHYYEVITVSGAGSAYTGGAQDPNGTKGDLSSGSYISWEEARCRAKYLNGRFGGTVEAGQMSGTTRVAGRTTQADDGCVAISGSLTLRTVNGLPGHLANITTLAEHEFLRSKLSDTGWIGGSDIDTEGRWIWMDGPEAGQAFWIEGTTSARRTTNTVEGSTRFNYWSDGEPNNASGEHWAEFGFGTAGVGSSWNDCRNGCNRTRYVVEYSATGGVVPPVLSASRSVRPLPSQTITFAPASTLTYGDPSLTLATSSSSGGAVALAVTSGSGTTCSLSGTTLTWVAPGECIVTATQAGNDAEAADGGIQPAPALPRTITMAPKDLPITGLSAIGRVYDGTTSVAIAGAPTFAEATLIAGDVGMVSAGGSPVGALSSAAAGTSRSVTVSGVTLSGARAFAYRPVPATLSVDIAQRPVRIDGSFTVADRAYDGSTAVTASSQSLVLRSSDIVAGDTASLSLSSVTFAADLADAGTRTASPVAATLTGARAADYSLDVTGAPAATFAITAVPLTVTSGAFTVADKVYDGTDTATISGNTLVLTGFVGGDAMEDITWSPTGRFTTTTAGTARMIELVGGPVLGGPRGGGYTLDVAGAPTATATITPRPLTVTGATAAARPYDGTTSVSVSGAALANTVAGDAVTLANATAGTAASRDAGTRAVTTAMTLAGADAANYVLVGQPALSVTISPLPVSVAMNALPSRPYDGTTALPLAAGAFTVSGTIPGESIGVSGTAQLSSRAAGTRTVALTAPTFTPGGGTNLANYTLPSSVTGTVTVTPLNVRVVGATVTQRAWDGTTSATVTGATLEGVRAGDAVSLAGATSGVFASAQPGTHAVAYSPTLVGVDAANYRLDVLQLTGTISRASATLRITGGLTQIADGSARQVRTAVSPTTAGRIVVTYPGGTAPSAPGTYPVSVRLESATHDAPPVQATLTIQGLDSLLFPGLLPTAGTTGTTGAGTTSGATTQPGASDDPAVRAARMEQLMARMAVRPDGTLALPEVGPVLERDGTAPALIPRDHRVLEDGEPSTARVTIVEQQRVRIERDDSGGGGFSIDLQAASNDASRTPLPVDADGTLLLDRGGFVEVGGSGFLSGSTAEVWMFSTATFLGTAIVNADGTFEGSFPVDDLLESGDHTIQLNGIGADEQVRSSSLGVRIDDPDAPTRERIVLVTEVGGLTTGTSGWLLLLVGIAAGATGAWWLLGGRRRREE